MNHSRSCKTSADATPYPSPRSKHDFRAKAIMLPLALLLSTTSPGIAQAVKISDDVSPSPATTPTWNVGGALIVGDTSKGKLEIGDTGAVSNTSGFIGSGAAATGTAIVTGGTWTNSLSLFVGSSGNGTLEISGSGVVSNSFAEIGNLVGSTGLVKVSGGSWVNSDYLRVGNQGDGALEISGTGSVSNTGTVIGSTSGSTGLATITGGSWTQSDSLVVGLGGEGTLEISGGSVSSVGGVVANNLSSTGTVRVSGGSWTNSGGLSIGVGGNGILEISGTGSVSNTSAIIGGDVTVSGGSWTNSGQLNVSGNGVLEINGSGVVSAASSSIAVGTAIVSGGRFTVSDWLEVGANGEGTLEISGNGEVSATTVVLSYFGSNSKGTLNLYGGTLSTSHIYEDTGDLGGSVNFNGGTLRLTNNQSNLFGFFEAGDVSFTGSGGTIDTQGFSVASSTAFSGNGGLTKTGSGSLTLSSSASDYSGGTTVSEGTLVAGSNSALGSGNVTINGGTLLAANGVTLSNDLILSSSGGESVVVAYWNFNELSIASASAPGEGGVPTTISANQGSGTLSLTTWGGTVDDFGGSTINALNSDPAEESLSLVGTSGNGTSIFLYGLDFSGLTDAEVTFATRGTSTGFDTGQWAYSTDGDSYTDFGVNTATKSTTFALAETGVTAGLDSVESGSVRYTLGGSSGGNNRIDNLQVTALTAVQSAVIGSDVVGGSAHYSGDGSITGHAVLTAASDGTVDFSGNLSGSGSVTKEGAGTVILSGNNTYAGATLVSAGTLLVTGALSDSAVTVDGGAFGGTGTVASLDITSGLFHVADIDDALAVSGTISIYAGFSISDLAGVTWGALELDTAYTLIAGTLAPGVFATLDNNSAESAFDVGGGRSAYFREGSLQLVVIPEPSAALLFAFAALALLRRRRN